MDRQSQKGAALVTGLMILVIMSLVGVSVMETAVLQTSLASNSQFKSIAFHEAEAALKRGSTLKYMKTAMDRDPADDPTELNYTDSMGSQETAVSANATTIYCGTLASQNIRGLSLDANQAANSNSYTRYAFDVTATVTLAVAGHAGARHTQRSSRLMLAAPGAAGNVC